LNDVAQKLGSEARVNLRLSGFPLENITSPNIFTCGGWTKFGTDIRRARKDGKRQKRRSKRRVFIVPGKMLRLGTHTIRNGKSWSGKERNSMHPSLRIYSSNVCSVILSKVNLRRSGLHCSFWSQEEGSWGTPG
jgi:hypothetical protein